MSNIKVKEIMKLLENTEIRIIVEEWNLTARARGTEGQTLMKEHYGNREIKKIKNNIIDEETGNHWIDIYV